MNVVDSSGWLEYFADGPNANFFAPAIEAAAELIVPSVSVYEVFKRVHQQKGEDDAHAQPIPKGETYLPERGRHVIKRWAPPVSNSQRDEDQSLSCEVPDRREWGAKRRCFTLWLRACPERWNGLAHRRSRRRPQGPKSRGENFTWPKNANDTRLPPTALIAGS